MSWDSFLSSAPAASCCSICRPSVMSGVRSSSPPIWRSRSGSRSSATKSSQQRCSIASATTLTYSQLAAIAPAASEDQRPPPPSAAEKKNRRPTIVKRVSSTCVQGTRWRATPNAHRRKDQEREETTRQGGLIFTAVNWLSFIALQTSGVHPLYLHRLLRMLAGYGVFAEKSPRRENT